MQPILKTELAKGLNIEDKKGVRPLHLAATVSEQYVVQLVDAGADVIMSLGSPRKGRQYFMSPRELDRAISLDMFWITILLLDDLTYWIVRMTPV